MSHPKGVMSRDTPPNCLAMCCSVVRIDSMDSSSPPIRFYDSAHTHHELHSTHSKDAYLGLLINRRDLLTIKIVKRNCPLVRSWHVEICPHAWHTPIRSRKNSCCKAWFRYCNIIESIWLAPIVWKYVLMIFLVNDDMFITRKIVFTRVFIFIRGARIILQITVAFQQAN